MNSFAEQPDSLLIDSCKYSCEHMFVVVTRWFVLMFYSIQFSARFVEYSQVTIENDFFCLLDSGSRWERLKLGIQSKIQRFTKSTEDVSTLALASMSSAPTLDKSESQPSNNALYSTKYIAANGGLGSGQDRSRLRDKIRRVTLNLKTNWLQRTDGSESDESDLDHRYHRRDSTHEDMSSFINPTMKAKTHQLGLQGSSKLWFGKDYANFLLRDFRNLDQPFQDQIDRNTTPRMPWHDIGAFVYGACARDLARHFIERWNFVKRQKVKDDEHYPFLLPKTYGTYTPCPKLLSNTFNCSTQVTRKRCVH